jgi:CBS domain-containing protein
MELATTNVSAICKASVIFLDQTYTINDALKILFANAVSAAPVINNESRLCTGMIDSLDMLGYVLSVPMDAPTWASEVMVRFNTPIYRSIDFSGRDPVINVNDTTRLSDVIALYLRRGVHRVLVQNANSNIVGILSQADVMDLLQRLMESNPTSEISKMGARNLGDFEFPTKVICVPHTSNLLAAFQLLISNRISSVAVIDHNASIVGNISATDFQNINSSNFTTLGTILQSYLTVDPVFATRATSLLGAIKKMNEAKVHRIYVVDDNKTPVGVLSMTDVMAIVAKELNLDQAASIGV